VATTDQPSIELDQYHHLTSSQVAVLLVSIGIVALCGITYELIIGTVSTYLLGNSVYQFSLTIGFFMFAMGIGSYLSKAFVKNLLGSFIFIEIAISIIGGICSLSLFMTYSIANAMYQPVMYLFIISIGILVGLEIPILTRILAQKEIIRKSIANVLSLDYIGALIGSIAFPLLLLPNVGLIRSSFIIGVINILTALVNLVYFRHTLPNFKTMCSTAMGTLLLLVALTIGGSKLTSFAEHHLYQDQVIYDAQTPYQKVVFTQNNLSGNYRMYIDGHIQFSERDEHRYHESLVHPVMSLPGPRQHILILGGGDGLAAREVLKYREVKSIKLVDIDPQITEFSAKFPALKNLNNNSLRHEKLKVINQDAFNYIYQSQQVFDRIIIDMPDPHNEALSKLYSREFYHMLRNHLHPQGAMVTQSSSPFFARKTFWSIEKTLRSAGLSTFSYHLTVPSFGIWGYHIASLQPVRTDQFKIIVPTRYLTEEVLAAASVFGKDTTRVEVPVNTLMEPKLYMLYIADLAK